VEKRKLKSKIDKQSASARNEFALIANERVPTPLAQCWFPALAIFNAEYKYIFQMKYTEAILSNSTRKLLWFENETTKNLNASYCVSYYNFRHTSGP